MRVKEQFTYQKILYDIFKMRELIRGHKTGTYNVRNDDLFDVLTYIWLDKPLILRGIHSKVPDGFDAYYFDAPSVDGKTNIILPNQLIVTVFHRCKERIYIPTIEKVLKTYGVDCTTAKRDFDDKVYSSKINGKFYCMVSSFITGNYCCETGQIWATFDKPLMKTLLGDEYYSYRMHRDRADLSDTLGNIDTDVVALEDLIPSLDRVKLLQEIIAEMRIVVDGAAIALIDEPPNEGLWEDVGVQK